MFSHEGVSLLSLEKLEVLKVTGQSGEIMVQGGIFPFPVSLGTPVTHCFVGCVVSSYLSWMPAEELMTGAQTEPGPFPCAGLRPGHGRMQKRGKELTALSTKSLAAVTVPGLP